MTGVLGLIDRRFKATDWRDGSIIIPTTLGLAGGGVDWMKWWAYNFITIGKKEFLYHS